MGYNLEHYHDDPWIKYAEQEIRSNYGDSVSVLAKSKSLLKFGKNTDLGTSSETVQAQGGNETYVTTNAIDTISSSSASDTNEVTVEGHTISGGVFTFVTQTVTLTGQTKALLATPLARCSRVYNVGAVNMLGNIYVYEDTAISSGAPTDATKIHVRILAGEQQTYKCSTTFSDGDYAIITNGFATVDKKTAASVDFVFEVRPAGSVFRPVLEFGISTNGGAFIMPLQPFVVVPKNADIRVTAAASTTGVSVRAGFQAALASVIE